MTRNERLLLSSVSRHLRTEVDLGRIRLRNGRWHITDLIKADFTDTGLRVWRRERCDQIFPEWGDHYPATSVREAVDLAAALRLLPARFSSAYWAVSS